MRARICQVVLDVLPRDRKQSVQRPQPSQAGQEEEVVVGVGVIPSCVQRVRRVTRAELPWACTHRIMDRALRRRTVTLSDTQLPMSEEEEEEGWTDVTSSGTGGNSTDSSRATRG